MSEIIAVMVENVSWLSEAVRVIRKIVVAVMIAAARANFIGFSCKKPRFLTIFLLGMWFGFFIVRNQGSLRFSFLGCGLVFSFFVT